MELNRIKNLEELIIKLEQKLSGLKALSSRLGLYRLVVFFLGTAGIFLVFLKISETAAWLTLGAVLLLFAFLSNRHSRIESGIEKLSVWIRLKSAHSARARLEWRNIPESEDVTPYDTDPAATDLNLTGHQSLFHLLNLSISKEGGRLLKRWLLEKAPSHKEIIDRQKIIKELIPMVRFRDRLLLHGALASKRELNGQVLIDWINTNAAPRRLRTLLLILSILAPLNTILIVIYFAGHIPAYWAITTLIYSALYMFNSRLAKDTNASAEFMSGELGKFGRILRFLEHYNYRRAPDLKEFCAVFTDKGKSPSAELDKVKSIVSVLSLQHNPFIWMFMIAVFPLDYYYAYKLDRLRNELSSLLPEWLSAWFRLEAMISLANFAYLNPGYTFPEIKTQEEENIEFKAEDIGHPLIPMEHKVRNSFSFTRKGEVVIITGSNMSGKSTFLRTMGINMALAYAGGVTDSRRFSLSIFRVFTCIKVSDSVIDGISYFYAEVKRLKALLDELNRNDERPLFFLIDEIFRGTNNVERLIGSRSYIKALSDKNGVGAISTHDLELVKLADENRLISNYHFREETDKGRMIFDYKLRQGPCPTTNALKIMAVEGLPVDQ